MWAAIEAAIDVFLERGSGWVLEDCVRLRILCHKVIAFAQLGSSYLALPSAVKNKHACVNVQNTDNDCFAYAVLSALLCDDTRVRASNTRATVYRQHMNALVFERSGDKIKMPFDVKDAPKFEAWNSQPISILGLDISDVTQGMQYYRDRLDIEYMSQLPSAKPVIWLIRIYNEDNSHYVWLKKPKALLRLSSAVNPCTRCLRSFKRVGTTFSAVRALWSTMNMFILISAYYSLATTLSIYATSTRRLRAQHASSTPCNGAMQRRARVALFWDARSHYE